MICIGCGCDESQACTLPGGEPCAWIHVGVRQLVGICTACVELYASSEIDEELEAAEDSLLGEAEGMGYIDRRAAPSIASLNAEREQLKAEIADRVALEVLGPQTESALARLRAMSNETPRLILPGDEEFHL